MKTEGNSINENALEAIIQGVIAGLRDYTPLPYLTPPQIADQLGVHPAKVVGWIKQGELLAANVADRASSRPRWKVSQESLQNFLRGRAPTPTAPTQKRRKRRQADTAVTAYY